MKTELRGGNLCPRLTVLDPQLDVLWMREVGQAVMLSCNALQQCSPAMLCSDALQLELWPPDHLVVHPGWLKSRGVNEAAVISGADAVAGVG